MLNEFINENIKCRYVINLKHRTDRYEEFKKRCEKLFDYTLIERFDAIHGITVDQDKLEYSFLKRKKNKGELGCFLSHYNIWKKIVENTELKNDDIVLIFEDDVFFNERFFSRNFKEAILDFKKISEESKLLYIGGRFKQNFTLGLQQMKHNWKIIENNRLKERVFNMYIDDVVFDRTTHAYIITKKGAEVLYNEVNNKENGKRAVVDIYLLWYLKHNSDKIKSYDYFPHLCYSPADYKTDIYRK